MRWKPWLTVAVLLLSLAVLAGWQYHEYLQDAELARDRLHRQAHAIINAIVGGFQSHRRRGPFFIDQTQGAFEGLVRAQDILAVAVFSQDGQKLLAAGRQEQLPEMSDIRAGNFWDETAFRRVERFELPPSPSTGREEFGHGLGRRRFAERRDRTARAPDGAESENRFAAGGPFIVALLLDRSQVDVHCRSEAWLRGTLVVVGGLLLLGVTLAWQITVRAAGRARLLEIETRHLRELSQAAAGLAHETRNPLGLIRGWAQRLAQSEFPSAEQQVQADAIVEECDRVTARINQFLAYARPRQPQLESIAIEKLVKELAIVLEPDLEEKRVTLDYNSLEMAETIRGDREMLRQALFNLIQNAIQASPEGKTVEIHHRGGQDGVCRIEVMNHGSPVPDMEVQSLFTPYFTTRPDGTGLGLAIVRHIASVHGWQAGYTPRPGGGISSGWINCMAEKPRTILVVDDHQAQRRLLGEFVESLGLVAREAASAEVALKAIRRHCPAMVLLDVRLPGMNGIEALVEIRKLDVHLPVLLITAYADLRQAVEAMKTGADDYLSKPVDLDELATAITDALGTADAGQESNNRALPELPDGFICESAAMRHVVETSAFVAPSDAPVLITGPSGAGKEVVARLIHSWSGRAGEPLVVANCAGLPETLIESELFGHTRGAFTGATDDRSGFFRTAHQGTLFLDEIGELPLHLQPKLLRALESGQITPVGSDHPVEVDTRLVAATNRDLAAAVRDGQFREDLYYRINVVELAVPPLSQHREDIPKLARQFATQYAGGPVRLSPQTMHCLVANNWTGNVRELRNAMQRACLLCRGDIILPEHLPPKMARFVSQDPRRSPDADRLSQVERATIMATLEECQGNRTQTAKKLGISRRALIYKLRAIEEEVE